ncbi:MAG: ABC transporter permease [Thermaerobacterales bacterium]
MNVVTALVLFGVIVLSLAAPWIAPFGASDGSLSRMLEMPSAEHRLGTDHLGRDMLSRILYAGRLSLGIGFGALLFGLTVGGGLGLITGYFGGRIDGFFMRGIDVMMSFPEILFAIMIVSVLGFSTTNVVIAIGFGAIPSFARLTRSLVMHIQGEDFTMAARSLGAGDLRIIGKHVIPNIVSPLIVFCSLALGRAILAEAGLSFIGLGIQSPDTSWGVLVAEGRQYLRSYPHLSVLPGLAIMVTVFCLNILGDSLRDALDPRLRGT